MLTTRFRDEWARQLRLRANEQADVNAGDSYLYRPPDHDEGHDDPGGYCCLGIATCHVIRVEILADESAFTELPSHLDRGQVFTLALARYVFPRLCAILGQDRVSTVGERAFAAMNDNGWSFNRIANVVEHLPTDDQNGYDG